MKHIKKKSVVSLQKAVGSISDTLNVEDKVHNAPSINLVQQMAGIPQEGIIAFDGTEEEIPEGYEKVNGKTIITGKLGSVFEKIAEQNYALYPIPFSQSTYKGNKIVLQDDGGFLIGKGIDFVKVNSSLTIQSGEENIFGMEIHRKRDGGFEQYARTFSYKYGNSYRDFNLTDCLIDVKEGDLIYVLIYIDMSGSYAMVREYSYATVEEV